MLGVPPANPSRTTSGMHTTVWETLLYTLSMWLQDMPALPSRKNVHLTIRQEKLAEQKIRTSVQMPPYEQISIKERSIKSVVLLCR